MRRFAASLRHTSALTAILCALAPPAVAETIAPPGNSGVDQYFEVVPSAKGNSKPDGKRKALPQKAVRELEAHGEEGRQLQRIVEATGPAAEPERRPAKQTRKPESRGPAAAPRGDSPLSSAAKALTDSDGGGMGMALPALLIVSTTVLAAVALRRRHSA